MRTTIITISLLLAGCATTPAEVFEHGKQATFSSSKAPEALARCIDRNAENNFYGAIQSKVTSTGTEPIEVMVRNTQNSVQAIAQIRTSKTGSVAQVFFGYSWSAGDDAPAPALKLLTKGCE